MKKDIIVNFSIDLKDNDTEASVCQHSEAGLIPAVKSQHVQGGTKSAEAKIND